MATAKFAVALHAGTSDTWNNDAVHQQEVEKILKTIAETAGAKLSSGAKAIDVVQAVVTSLEDCPLFNAGKGAVLNKDSEHELEAAIADGTSGAYGAVAATRNIRNPIEAARAVMEQGRHSFLVGPAADEFARKSGVTMVSNDYFTTATKKARWEARARKTLGPPEDLETVGGNGMLVDTDVLKLFRERGDVYRFQCSEQLVLDVTEITPVQAAEKIMQHVRAVCGGRGEEGRKGGGVEEQAV